MEKSYLGTSNCNRKWGTWCSMKRGTCCGAKGLTGLTVSQVPLQKCHHHRGSAPPCSQLSSSSSPCTLWMQPEQSSSCFRRVFWDLWKALECYFWFFQIPFAQTTRSDVSRPSGSLRRGGLQPLQASEQPPDTIEAQLWLCSVGPGKGTAQVRRWPWNFQGIFHALWKSPFQLRIIQPNSSF